MAPVGCSLIITTYNWPVALRCVLQSIRWQSVAPCEILIADDGSSEETKTVVERISAGFPIPIKHFWQEDIKKRKTRINNIAIANASYPYLIFIDHDIVLHPDFIKDHLALAEKGYFLNGSRFLVDPQSTNTFLQRNHIQYKNLLYLSGKNKLNRIRLPFLMNLLAHRYQTSDDKTVTVRGCNMSFWKKDLVSVNGYDENYQGWGREDSDIAVRLFNKGIKKKSIKFGAVAYHLYHREGNKTDDAEYMAMLSKAISEKSIWAANGLDQHL